MKWTTDKIGALCEITSSKRIYAHEYTAEGVPFFRGKEVVEKFNGAQNVSTELFIPKNRFEEIADKFGAPQIGDLLLTSVGTLGVPYYVSSDDEFYFKDGNLTWFRSFNGLNSKFVYYWLQSPNGKAELNKSTIGTSQAAYTIILLKQMKISAPSFDTQQRIASILSTYDNLIENNRRRIALLEDAARQVYQEWFVRLRFPGREHTRIVDGVPDGWERKKLRECVTLSYGKALKAEIRVDGPFPVYGSSGIVGSHEKALVPGPAIILGRKGNVGSVFWSNKDFYPIDTVYFINAESSSFYLYYALKNMHFMSTDVAVPGLNRDFAYSRELLLPPGRILHSFIDAVTPMHEQLSKLGEMNQKLRSARDLLLPKLMNGEVSV